MSKVCANPIRMMSINVWGDYFENPVAIRDDQLLELFKKYRPDIIGLQEMTQGWYDSKLLSGLKSDFAIAGAVLGAHVNYVPLAYNKHRFELHEAGLIRYSHTPDQSKGITYAVLKEYTSPQMIAACNTHFWWKPGAEHDLIRQHNAQEFTECMHHLQEKYACPVFGFGDMNCTISSEAFRVFKKNRIVRLHDLAQQASEVSSHHGDPLLGLDGRYHGTRTANPDSFSIDHIIGLFGAQPYEVLTYQVVMDQSALDASDHSPIYADIALTETTTHKFGD